MKKFTWIHKIEFDLLNDQIIEAILKLFFKEVMDNFPKDQMVCIIFKAKYEGGLFRSLAPAQKVTSMDIEEVTDAIINQFSIKSEWYKTTTIEEIIIDYILLSKKSSKFIYNFNKEDLTSKEPEITHNLPNNTDITLWGSQIEYKEDHYMVYNDSGKVFRVEIYDNYQKVKLLKSDETSKAIIEFIDYFEVDSFSFKRVINDRDVYYFKNGICKYIEKSKKCKFITTKKEDLSIKKNFITMDFETRALNNKMHVITASIFDGYKVKSFFVTDFKDSEDLIENSIKYLLQRKYNGYKVYFHNFSNFDSIFMLRKLASIDNTNISRAIKRDSNIIEIKLDYNLDGKRKYSIYFRDSLLILPSSLKKLGSSFNVDIVKSIFPYNFVNDKNISLNYEGKVPSIKYFNNDITKDEYKTYASKFKNHPWSLKDESIKYCEIDVKSLWFILRKFQINIFNNFDVDFNNYPTLPSLAFGIFRVKYLKDNTIPKLSKEIYNNIVKSYTGGSVDVYKPIGENVNRYDVNSLYPSVMTKFPSPVGNIRMFKGNPYEYVENPFGFFNVKIHAPSNLNVPVLQTRVKTKSGNRTVAPIGNWEGWYFSEEITNAMKYGYRIEIIWGYLFDKEFIFKDYVEDLYKMKKESSKDSPMYTISKLLLNSLYGRFGMSPYKENHIFLKDKKAKEDFYNNNSYIITDSLDISSEVELVSYILKNCDEESLENINVSIASSITSYARIQMSKFKVKHSNNLYYSDTDSIDLNIKLEDKYLSNELGDFKHEGLFKEVVYIAPKVYSYITDNEQVTKIKGYKRDDTGFKELKELLINKDRIELTQTKFYKNLKESNILLKEEKYTLMVTENKRKLIYKNGNISTIPYFLKDGKLTN